MTSGPRLTLYGYPQCPFCAFVERERSSLGLAIPWRNTMTNPACRSELREALGSGTVPVLLIEEDGKDPVYMPESRDIAQYLRRFARVA